MIRALALAALLVVAVDASAQVKKEGSGYLFRVNYTKGQTLRYLNVSSVKGATPNGGPMNVQVPVVLQISDTKGESATVRMTVGPAKAGKQEVSPAQTAVMTLDRRNQAMGSSVSSGIGAQLPIKPVRIGQTWTSVAPISTASGTMQRLDAKYKFVGFKTVSGQQVAVITYTISGIAQGSGAIQLLVKDGTLFSNTSKLSMSAMSTKIVMDSNMKRL